MSRLEGSKFLPTWKWVLRADYEVDPKSKSSGTRSASGLGLCDGPAGALKGFQGTCRPRSWTGTPRRAKCTAGEHMRKNASEKGRGRWEWWSGQWQPQLGRRAPGDNVCRVLVLSGDTNGQGLGHLHRSSAPRLLPDTGSAPLTATPIPEPCSHAAYTCVLLATATDTALHIRVSGTPECQHQWGSALVPPNTNLGRLDPCTLWAQPLPTISKPVAGVIPDPRPERGLW